MKVNIFTKGNLKGFASIMMVILYPCIFMYLQNIGEGYFTEIFEAVAIFAILSFVIGMIAFIVLKDFFRAVFYSEAAMLILMNFNTILGLFKGWFPGLRKVYFFLILGLIGGLLLLFLKKKKIDADPLVTILGIVFGCLIAFNLVTSASALIQKITYKNETSASDEISKTEFDKTPNVYYLFYDEYGGFENLKRYYDYDNVEFETFLLEEGFNISYSSRNTESLYTSTILPNLLNLSYVASDEEYSLDNWAKTENCVMFQLFLNNGYMINLINHHDEIVSDGCNVLNSGQKRETLSTHILNNSIWAEVRQVEELIKSKVAEEETDYARILKDILNVTENSVDSISKFQPTLTVSYIVAPHYYFALNEHGQGISSEHELDFENKEFYLGQLKYVTKTIENTIRNIKEKDPNALIIVQSDHGMRYPLWMETYHDGPAYDKETENFYMQNVINCVYYQGEKIEIEGLSGINTLRTVFNHVLGTDFKMLDSVFMNPEEE